MQGQEPGSAARKRPCGLVYVVDDDASVRAALERLMRSAGHEVRCFASAEAFLAAAAPLNGPGCMLLDVRMPGMGGLALLGALNDRGVRLPIIIISGHGDIPMAVAAMKAGARDFVVKPFSGSDLLDLVGAALAAPAEAVAQGRIDQLTRREREVLALIVEGLSNKAIANRLSLSVRTVEVHRASAKKKLRVGSVAEMVRIAIAHGIQAPSR